VDPNLRASLVIIGAGGLLGTMFAVFVLWRLERATRKRARERKESTVSPAGSRFRSVLRSELDVLIDEAMRAKQATPTEAVAEPPAIDVLIDETLQAKQATLTETVAEPPAIDQLAEEPTVDPNACKTCRGAGAFYLDCGCSHECRRCRGTGREPSEAELADRRRLAVEDAALAASAQAVGGD